MREKATVDTPNNRGMEEWIALRTKTRNRDYKGTDSIETLEAIFEVRQLLSTSTFNN
jgi:hypothetical protein